ncbi:MAG TPA: condensation domain-containing protein, partial [Herpetosiphonaceae bacterium]
MTTAEFLALLQDQGITLRVEGDRLRYRGPKEVLTPEIHASIAARKAELIAALQSERTPRAAGPRPASRDRALPLSFAQQRLWFFDQLQPDSAAYNIHTTVALDGQLDIATLERSFTALVARHESLRTTFAQGIHGDEGAPVQVIAPPAPLPLPIHNLQTLPADQRLAEAHRIATAESQRPFDLAAGPLLRVLLLRLDPQAHVLLLTLHHIIADGWSIGILIRELAALYTAGGNPAVLPPLPIQYADYAIWQRDWLQGKVLEQQIDYWRAQLQGAPALLTLPTDRPRPAVQRFQGAQQTFIIPLELHAALVRLSQQEGVTLFMTLLAAWQVLLARYSGQNDIVVGTPIAGRTRIETEGLIGFFVNTLALRARLDGNPGFRALLRQVRETTFAAYAHQDIPFEQVVDTLQPTRDLSYMPLFQVLFALQNAPMPALNLEALTLRVLEMDALVAKFDLELSLEEKENGLSGRLIYNTALFDASTIARMVVHYQMLLAAAVADPDQPIMTLPLLTAAERALLLSWNPPATDTPPLRCLHHLVAAQAARTPHACAVVC